MIGSELWALADHAGTIPPALSWGISLNVDEPARSVPSVHPVPSPRFSPTIIFFLFGAKGTSMASAMEKERGSNDVSDEKLEAQKCEYVDAIHIHANDPIPDPDAGLSAEERAAIVRLALLLYTHGCRLTRD